MDLLRSAAIIDKSHAQPSDTKNNPHGSACLVRKDTALETLQGIMLLGDLASDKGLISGHEFTHRAWRDVRLHMEGGTAPESEL